MHTERPKTRLVGWGEYVRTICTKGMSYSIACVCITAGLGFLLAGGILLLLTARAVLFAPFHHVSAITILTSVFTEGVFGLGIGGIGAMGITIGGFFFREVRRAPPIALLTQSSAKNLAEVETLVRGSECPASDPQVELLRAVRQTPETPPEQLLRATQENS